MDTVDANVLEDLEDGEIESDPEQVDVKPSDVPAEVCDQAPTKQTELTEQSPKEGHKSKKSNSHHAHKSEKKKKNKQHKEEKNHKNKEKNKGFVAPPPVEDDFAGVVEKAIRLAMKQGGDDINDVNNRVPPDVKNQEEGETKRKHKKRKKHDQGGKDATPKKRKRREEPIVQGDEEMDEDEMLCIRGASPVHRQPHIEEPFEPYHSEDDYESYPSEASDDESHGRDRDRGRGGRQRGRMKTNRARPGRQDRRRIQDCHPMQDPDGVCIYYMQGKCYKGDDCPYSHDAHPPKKLELCKFYLMECCAKRDKCLYLHSDFPCKYYHTGLPCIYKDECKFAHGKPLSDSLRMILLKHIESAPKDILGEFPRLSRDAAAMMVNNTQMKLMQQYPSFKPENSDRSLPIFDGNSHKQDENQHAMLGEQLNKNEKQKAGKVRQSRWCDSSIPPPPVALHPPNVPNNLATQSILSVQNLNGVLTPQQISELVSLGIDNLNQLSQLTVIQLNELGLTMNQINEIQLNTMSIQKLGLINSSSKSSKPSSFFNKANKDLDMRVSPAIPEVIAPPISVEPLGKDVDMRFIAAAEATAKEESTSKNLDPRKQKTSIDIDQYTKDALKFSNVEKENIVNIDADFLNQNVKKIEVDFKKVEADVDHRVLKYVEDAAAVNVKINQDENGVQAEDTDHRLLALPAKQQEMFMRIQNKNEERQRRPTTDDEDDNLHIDEKWYSSDEENIEKSGIPKPKTPPLQEYAEPYKPTVKTELENTTVIKNLGDLSKIDISAEVTKLLTSIKSQNALPERVDSPETSIKKDLKSRDPRNIAKNSPDRRSSSDSVKKSSKPEFVSIYECTGTDSDRRKRADVDLRPSKDLDFRLPSFGDTDLRQTPGGGDVDLRLGLPFKPLPNYTPATEIDGSISSHPPITYKVHIVDVPRPDYTDIKRSTPRSQATADPRLRKIFRLSIDESSSDQEKSTKSSTTVRIDPRKRQKEPEKPVVTKPTPLDLQTVIQTSNWYRDLSSNQKILVNQQLATVTSSLKKFHQDTTPGKIFDLTEIKKNNVLVMIFSNLGIVLDEKGEFTQLQMQDSMPNMGPMNFNQNPAMGGSMFMGGNMGGMMDNMNMMGMNPMGNSGMGVMGNMPMGNMPNMNNMPNYDNRFQGHDPRNGPGLLGPAPNIPHNYDNSNYNGMPNFNQDNFNSNYDNSNNMFNGPGGNNMNDYGDDNYNDNDNFYPRNKKNDFNQYRGGGGRGERWNRGGSRGGNRDRRGYSDRGNNWKNDRR